MLAAYALGLSMGAHQMAIPALFPCFMLVYYRRRHETTTVSWLGMVAASVVAFFVVFQLILSQLTELLGGGGMVPKYIPDYPAIGFFRAAVVLWSYNFSMKQSAKRLKSYF